MSESSNDDTNPYTPTLSETRVVDVPNSVNAEPQWKLVLIGTMWSILSAFPIAGLMAIVFRFPIPFAGYLSGPSAVMPAMLAVIFYGVLGGFVLIGALGAIGGALTPILAPKLRKPKQAVCIVSVGITFICLFVLAILDYIVGPW